MLCPLSGLFVSQVTGQSAHRSSGQRAKPDILAGFPPPSSSIAVQLDLGPLLMKLFLFEQHINVSVLAALITTP